MRLLEHEAKRLFAKYGIKTPRGVVVETPDTALPPNLRVVKAQVPISNRFKAGGIHITTSSEQTQEFVKKILGSVVGGERVSSVLVEEHIDTEHEYYLSFSYSSEHRSPVLALSTDGGTGVDEAHVVPIDLTHLPDTEFWKLSLEAAGFPPEDTAGVASVIEQLWQVFLTEYALTAEINPLFKTASGEFIAGDAKIILDDEKVNPTERRYVEMDGDIAILASGGGASMLNMDALLRAGGKPANYTEYSGNPTADVVKELTKRVLSKPGLKGCWVVGAAANFTDIYVTLSGLLDGLREVQPKPTYPIVIRRDGPRREEAFTMLQEVSKKEGFDFHLFDQTTPMVATAKIMVELAYKK